VVFGGGGITPDVPLKFEDLTETQQAIERTSLPFNFANAYVGKSGFSYPDGFEHFLTRYEVSETTWKSFLTFAAEADSELTRDQLEAERTYIGQSVKREIAGNLWGPTERYRVMIGSDRMVSASIGLFEQASGLLALHAQSASKPAWGVGNESPATPMADDGREN
jgi:hypothetical protein